MKYVLVSGGVISGIGKGVIASSIGTLLKACGLRITSIKIDPYINIDAGTFSPYEHGEVYVLDDGGEVDLDLGNYERFLDITLHRDNNITTGKIYQHVINKERRGDYLGKTVQVVPHITDAIQEWVLKVARVPTGDDGKEPEVCIIELGGTMGDIESMPFVEAFRQFQFRVKKENFCSVHVTLVPRPKATGEFKTKPTQSSVRELRGLGISPDLIVCRSEQQIDDEVKQKISNFCHVSPDKVINMPDCSSIYGVPPLLHSQNVTELVIEILDLHEVSVRKSRRAINIWRTLAEKNDHFQKEVCIALVGKYTKLEDSYTSVIKALGHACLAVNRRLHLLTIDSENLEESKRMSDPIEYHEAWRRLCSAEGILVPGGFGSRGVEGKILTCKYARENRIPFLGICLGYQCAAIEFARNVLQWKDANSTESDSDTHHPVIIDMPEHHGGDMGGTMRLGKRRTIFKSQQSILRQLYGCPDSVEERHRHRYEVNPKYLADFEAAGMKFVGHDVDGERMEIMELHGPYKYFVGVQYHPEYLSRPLKPSPPYLGLILASCGKLDAYISKGIVNGIRSFSITDDSDEEVSESTVEHTATPDPSDNK